jgi:hypothetical protein
MCAYNCFMNINEAENMNASKGRHFEGKAVLSAV